MKYRFIDETESLIHYGTLGMKWGHRPSDPNPNDSSHHPVKGTEAYEAYYRKQGMSKAKAKREAINTDALVKTLKVVGGVALAAAIGYAGYTYYKRNADRIISSPLFRFSYTQALKGEAGDKLHDVFYATPDKGDAIKYRGIFGKQIGADGGQKPWLQVLGFETVTPQGWSKTIKARDKKGFKIAGDKNAHKIFSELINNNERFKSGVQEVLNANDPTETTANVRARYIANLLQGNRQQAAIAKAQLDIREGRIGSRAVYRAYNLEGMLGGQGDAATKTRDTFLDGIRKAGYDGILDVNDRDLSGYRSKAAVIIDNRSAADMGKAYISDFRKVPAAEVRKEFKKAGAMLVGEETVDTLAKTGMGIGITGGVGGVALDRNIRNDVNNKK